MIPETELSRLEDSTLGSDMNPREKQFPSMVAVLMASRPGHDNPEGSGTRYYYRARINSPSHFESLPIEIINNITNYLDGHYIALLRRVSKAFNNIFSCHDVVSHVLAHSYPYSWEATLPAHSRTKSVFDTVARRTYTQPRRHRPHIKERFNCFPLFCEEEEEVLVYQTGEQMWSKGWECTLWDLKRNRKVDIKLFDGKVGGCYNELGELYGSAVLENVRCYRGRGVMVLQGCHKHLKWLNPRDAMRGEFEEGGVELAHYGVNVAPRRTKHSHTFIQVYSLHHQNLGQLISSFSFYGNTPLEKQICNKHYFVAVSYGAIFIFRFPKLEAFSPSPSSTSSPHLKILLQKLPQGPPAIWTNHWCSPHRCILTPDSLGRYFFLYADTIRQGFSQAQASVKILSVENGGVLKTTTLGESYGCFEWRLEHDDSRLLAWRFEPGIKPKSRCLSPGLRVEGSRNEAFEEGEEVRLTWVGTYGLYGTRGHRVGIDGLDKNGVFTGEKTPVMVEWRVNTLRGESPNDLIFFDRVLPTLYFSPTEFYRGKGDGVMGVPAQVVGWEEMKRNHELVRWPVGVNPYKFGDKEGQRGMLKWGGGVNGFYTTSENEIAADRYRTVTLWYDRSAEVPWRLKDERRSRSSGTMLFPRWKSVLDNSSSGGERDLGKRLWSRQGETYLDNYEKPRECGRLGGKLFLSECERDYKRQLEWERQKREYERRKELKRHKEAERHREHWEREENRIGIVDNTFFYEGCGWILYRIQKERRDWRKEERERWAAKNVCEVVDDVEVVDYDDVADDSDGDIWEADRNTWHRDIDGNIHMLCDGSEKGNLPDTEWEGESKLMYLMF